ncbi:hypothetical protein VIBNISOn1_1050004 [Vibrio nigripulchritudo SOn1]|uniref:Uncharacterized protein n=1 Tax=Vibrio nigripulchritudo SOn1 TaxID=1238450 RepID=A0AAV2VI26_9VIBR|nr:hypothetical protein [Vibrio nigripulchritudo]CCO44178.1 hypothetical protein VIBNISOn1_1050004 [Vibrio nigripulchritudo SOn1]
MATRGNRDSDHFGQVIDGEQSKADAMREVQITLERAKNALATAKNSGLTFSEIMKSLSAEQKALFEQEIESGASQIFLPLGREFRMIPFELYEISPDEIETRTRLHKANIRLSKYFSKFDIQKCKEMLKLSDPNSEQKDIYANTTPALGTVADDGVLDIFDGMRRRYGAMGTCPLKVYATKEPLTHFHAQLASDKNNDHLVNGFLDRRKIILDRMNAINSKREVNGEESLSDVAMARELNINRSLLQSYYKSQLIPDELLIAFPSPTSLGRPTINKLTSLFEENGVLYDNDELLAKCVSSVEEMVAKLDTSMSSDAANKAAMNTVSTIISEYLLAINGPKPSSAKTDFEHGSITVNPSGSLSVSMDMLTAEAVASLISELNKLLDE